MKKQYILILLIFSTVILSQSKSANQLGNSSEPYVTGDDGIVRMYVNVLGHVQSPGTFLVYESIDIFSLLALGIIKPLTPKSKYLDKFKSELFDILTNEIFLLFSIEVKIAGRMSMEKFPCSMSIAIQSKGALDKIEATSGFAI